MADADQDFRPAIQAHFGALLTQHGFVEVAAINEGQGEYQMLIFASPQCQMKFICERQAVSILFGRSSAPRIYPDLVDDQRVWFTEISAILYENQAHPGQAHRVPPGLPHDASVVEGQLRAEALLLAGYMDRLVAAFSPTPPPGWWAGFSFYNARGLAKAAMVGTDPGPP